MKQTASNIFLGDIASFLFEGIVLTDLEGVVLALNQVVSDFFPKLSDSDLIGKRIQDFVLNKELEHFYLHKQEVRNIPLSIGMFQLMANCRTVGENIAMVNFRNITKTQRLTQELTEAHNQIRLFQQILDSIDEGLCFIDNHQRIVFYNKKMGELDSKEPIGVLGKNFSSVFENVSHYVTPLLNSLVSNQKIIQNEAFFSKTGKRYIVNKTSEPLFLGSQKVGALSTVKDFSNRASMADALFRTRQMPPTPDLEIASEKELPPIIQSSKSMKKVMEVTELATESAAHLLICGENGVGKSLLARSIIQRLELQEEKFHELNCADIPSLLMEEHLFGTTEKSGILEQMNGGLIVLDHIDHLSLTVQERLLRIIRSNKFFHPRNHTEIHVNIRFIALLSQKPNIALKQGTLLEDMFYALSNLTLMVPSLRERKEDLPLLIHYFLKQKNESLKEPGFAVSPEAMKLLTAYEYPGNIRQLEYILEGAQTLAKDDRLITQEHLPPYMTDFGEPGNEDAKVSIRPDAALSLTEQVENFEKELIQRMLKKTHYHITKTADNLGVSRQSLNYKIRKYEIEIIREDE